MKRIALVALLLLSVSGWASTVPTEYSVNVHVSSDRFSSACSIESKGCAFALQILNVTIDGKKYELQAKVTKQGLLPLGDYTAIPTKQVYGLAVYELRLPDNKTEKFTVVGQSE
ncbi:MAG: hypothetical protein WA700_10255 [Acidobacteriaceae bacterium]